MFAPWSETPFVSWLPSADIVVGCLQAFVVVGDYNGHVGLGVKCAKEVRGNQTTGKKTA